MEIRLLFPPQKVKNPYGIWGQEEFSGILPDNVPNALRKMGENPDDWFCVYRTGKNIKKVPLLCLPNEMRSAIEKAIKDRKSEISAFQSDPANIERAAIHHLYEKAERLANSQSEDNVSGPIRMRIEADRRLKEWRVKYPKAAALEHASNLHSQAEHQRHLGRGAMTYDADGWISPEGQEKRRDECFAKANRLDAEAARIEAENK